MLILFRVNVCDVTEATSERRHIFVLFHAPVFMMVSRIPPATIRLQPPETSYTVSVATAWGDKIGTVILKGINKEKY